MRKSVNSELKVKHPYSYLIKVILLGIVMLFSGIFSAVMINEISHSHVMAWTETCPDCGVTFDTLGIYNSNCPYCNEYTVNLEDFHVVNRTGK